VVGHPQGTALTKGTALMRVARGPVPARPPTLAAGAAPRHGRGL